MGFFKNVKSDIKIFPAESVNALYSATYGGKIRYQPEDVITFSNEFVCSLINKYYEYDKSTKLLSAKSRYDYGITTSPYTYTSPNYNSIIEHDDNECVNLISSLRNIVDNLGDYVVDKKDPATAPPVILPVVCKEYKDKDWILIGGASFRCRQCAFVGDADHTGLHCSTMCNKMNCEGLVFKKLYYDIN